MIRLTGALFFGSVENVEREIHRIRTANGRKKNVVLYLKSVRKLDLSAGDMLIKLIRDIRAEGGEIHIVAGTDTLYRSLERFHVTDILGEDHLHSSKSEAVLAITGSFERRICQACLIDVFRECDPLRDGLLPTRDGSDG